MPRVPSPSLPHVLVGSLLLLVLVMAQAAHPPSTAAASCTRHVNVDRSGRTDVTAELNRFIANSRSGSKICFARNGRYKVNGTLHINGRSHLRLKGRGATIFQTQRSQQRIVLIDHGGTDIWLSNLTIRGANPRPGVWNRTYEHNHAIQVGGTTHLHLGNVRIRSVGGDGLYMGAGRTSGGVRWTASVRLHHSSIDGTGRSGVSIADGARQVSVDHTAFRRIAYYTFNIEPNGMVWNGNPAGARDVRFIRNRLSRQPFGTGRNGQPDGYAFVVTGSSGGGPADDILVKRNRIAGKPFRIGVFDNGGSRRNIRVVANRSNTRVGGPVMHFGGVRTLVVTRNRQPLRNGKLVSTSGCSNVLISRNVIS
jgi:hypothetical protein